MHYTERKKFVKSISVSLPRKEAILAIRREFSHLGMADAKDFYDKITNGGFNGQEFGEYDEAMRLAHFCDWCDVELEDEPFSKEELEHQEKVKAAEAWLETLSPQDKAHHDLLISEIPRMVACAAG